MANESTFETKLTQLEEIVNHLEQGSVPLEEALANFKDGVSLSQDLQKQLTDAGTALTKIIENDNSLTDFDTSTDDKSSLENEK